MNVLQALSDKSASAGLPFLIIGGYAVMAHGFARSTFDLDLLIRRSDAKQWTGLATELGFTFFRQGPTFVQFNPPSPDVLPLDLMLVGEGTFERMQAAAVTLDGGGSLAKVVSLEHLVALKCHAIHHGTGRRAVKDAEDLIQLLKANRRDPAMEPLRGLILKHGGQELYDKLRRATALE